MGRWEHDESTSKDSVLLEDAHAPTKGDYSAVDLSAFFRVSAAEPQLTDSKIGTNSGIS